MAVDLKTRPPPQGFNAEQWKRLAEGTNMNGTVAPEVWHGLSPEQQRTFIDLRRQLFDDGHAPPPRRDDRDRLQGGHGGGHFVGRDPVGGRGREYQALDGGAGLDMTRVNLNNRPERTLFNDAQWGRIVRDPLDSWPDEAWTPLTPAQKRAVFDLKDEAYGQLGVRRIQDVIAETQASAPNPEVVAPWHRKSPTTYVDQHISGENDFNPAKNPNHDDGEYTAAAGYTLYMRDQHLHNHGILARSVADGGADTISVTEFEDLETLQQLVDQELPGRGYHAYLIEGMDHRGINVGIMTKLPLWPGTQPKLIIANGADGQPIDGQRGTLKLELNVNGKHVVRYVFHAKSMRDGEAVSLPMNERIFAAVLADQRETKARDPKAIIICKGDSNMKYFAQNHEQALKDAGIERDRARAGKEDGLWDSTSTIPDRRNRGVQDPLLPAGTHIFHGEGDFLDRELLDANAAEMMVPNSLVALPHVNRFFDRRNHPLREGDSDHASLVSQFELA